MQLLVLSHDPLESSIHKVFSYTLAVESHNDRVLLLQCNFAGFGSQKKPLYL